MSIPVAVVENSRGESVQGRAEKEPVEGNPLYLVMQAVDQTSELPPWWTPWRDSELRRFYKKDGLFASAMYNIQAVTATTGWVVEGEADRAVERSRQVLANAEYGQGFKVLLKKLAEDWLTQDNGFFVEIIAPGSKSTPIASPPVGLAHLDAGRCWRTGDPEFPVWYLHPQAKGWIKLHWTRVAFQSANPSPIETARGVGFCAVSRAASIMATMRDTVRYKLEKISGRQTRAILLLSGAPKAAVEQAIIEAEENADNAGRTKVSSIPMIASPTEGTTVEASLVEFASLLDGFDWQTEITVYMYIIALALGIDARELWPATTSGATKADAEIQHRKAMRKGMGDFLTSIEFVINNYVLPPGVTFGFKPTDSEEDSIRAAIEKQRVDTVKTLLDGAVITPRGALLWLVNAGVLPAEYLENPDLSLGIETEPEPEPVAADETESRTPTVGESGEPSALDESGGEGGKRRGFFTKSLSERLKDWQRARLLRSIGLGSGRPSGDSGQAFSVRASS